MKINQSHSFIEIKLQERLLTAVMNSAQERSSVVLGKIRQSFRPSRFWRKRNSKRHIDAVEFDMDSMRVLAD